MDVHQAAADLAEVRYRLAGAQRFGGYSGVAAIASGVAALGAALLQAFVVPRPSGVEAVHAYLAIWLGTLAIALLLNYGAVIAWLAKHRHRHAVQQSRVAAFAMVPAIALGGALTVVLADRGLYDVLPGLWYGAYAVALFSSRMLVPTSVLTVAGGFGIAAFALLLIAPGIALSWWVMLGFGLGQIAIGACLARERDEALL